MTVYFSVFEYKINAISSQPRSFTTLNNIQYKSDVEFPHAVQSFFWLRGFGLFTLLRRAQKQNLNPVTVQWHTYPSSVPEGRVLVMWQMHMEWRNFQYVVTAIKPWHLVRKTRHWGHPSKNGSKTVSVKAKTREKRKHTNYWRPSLHSHPHPHSNPTNSL